MSKLIFVAAILAVSLTFVHAGTINREKRQTIPREFQNINIENYLKNPRAVQFQLKCVVYDGPCDRIGKYLKVSIPELLTNQCRNCQPDQKKQTGRLVAFLQQNYPKEWDDAIKKFQGGRQITGDEAKRLEQEFGVQVGAVSTISPPSAEFANVQVTTEKVSAAEISDIIKTNAAAYVAEQERLRKEKASGSAPASAPAAAQA